MRGLISSRLTLLAAGLLLLGASVAVAGARQSGDNSLSQLSTKESRDLVLAPSATRLLLDSGLGGKVSVVAERSGRSLYRLDGTSRGTCFGVGPRGDTVAFSAIKCLAGERFPSVSRPVLDLSLVELKPDSGVRILQLEGLAADGVSTIRVLGEKGVTIVEAPVMDNVYVAPGVRERATGLVGVDASDAVVYRFDFTAGGSAKG
jgi:hypothetical protein